MRKLSLKKIITMGLITTSILAVAPVGANAEWRQNNTGWWYSKANGGYSIGWDKIGNSWYYFDGNGYMKAGWVKDNGNWYYLKADGTMATGTVLTDGQISSFTNNGVWQGYVNNGNNNANTNSSNYSNVNNNTHTSTTTQNVSSNNEFTRDEAVDLALKYHQNNNAGLRIGLTGGAKNFKVDTLAEDTIREDSKGKYWLFGMINANDRNSYLGTLKVYANGTLEELQPGQFFGNYQYEKDYFMKVVHIETDAEKKKREEEEANIAAMRGSHIN